MAKDEQNELTRFLSEFSASEQKNIKWLRNFVWNLHPQANELIFDNHNDVIIYWSPTEKVKHSFCSVTADKSGDYIRFGFYKGDELTDPENLLVDTRRPYRYLEVPSTDTFPQAYITGLLQEAWINSLKRVKDYNQIVRGRTLTKSVTPETKEKLSMNRWINPNLGSILFLSFSAMPL